MTAQGLARYAHPCNGSKTSEWHRACARYKLSLSLAHTEAQTYVDAMWCRDACARARRVFAESRKSKRTSSTVRAWPRWDVRTSMTQYTMLVFDGASYCKYVVLICYTACTCLWGACTCVCGVCLEYIRADCDTSAERGRGVVAASAPPKVFFLCSPRCCKVRLRPQMRSARCFCGATPRFCGSRIGLVPMNRQRSMFSAAFTTR
jgi:hypothetical protein